MKHTLFVVCFFSSFLAGRAQQKMELRLGAGYGFSAGSHYTLDNPVYGNGLTHSVTSSFGQGISVHADATWWLNPVFGITAGGSYNSTLPDATGHNTYNGLAVDYYTSSRYTWQSSMALAMAGIALKLPGSKLNPYARLGAVLPVYTHLTEETDWSSSGLFPPGTRGTYKRTFRLQNTLGYTASMGIAPALNKHVALFAAINIQALSILARHATLTSNTINGVEQIGAYYTSFKEVNYVKKTPNPNVNAGQASEQPTFSFPYSSIGLQMGISIKL